MSDVDDESGQVDPIERKTYAETRRSPFLAGYVYSAAELYKMLKRIYKVRTGSEGRRDTAAALTKAVGVLQVEHGITEFLGAKVQRLYESAARECGWFVQPVLTDRRVKSKGLSEIVCPKCLVCKPRAEFMGVPSLAQRKQYGWPMAYKELTLQKVCTECRKLKDRRAAHSEVRRRRLADIRSAEAGSELHTWVVLRAHTRSELIRIRAAIQPHKVKTYIDGARKITYNWQSEHHGAYYNERLRLALLAQKRVNDMAGTAEWDDWVAEGYVPVWYNVLTPEEKAHIGKLFSQVPWVSKGRLPVLWN